MIENIKQQITESIATKQRLLEDMATLKAIGKLARLCADAISEGNKILIAGNGGSAADAQHIAAELVGRYQAERDGWAAIALTTDSSILTAVANDYGFEAIFRRQLQALAHPGDIFIGLSTSGNSANIIAAFEEARANGVFCAGLAGGNGGKMMEACDLCIVVPSADTPRIQESHITIGHILCALIEQRLVGAA